MDANGSRFHLLLGREDWGACTLDQRSLQSAWDASPADEAGIDVAWDDRHCALTLAPLTPRFVAARGDVPPDLSQRRGAACDAYGNIYWIDEDRLSIRVISSGTGKASRYWPDEAPADCADAGGGFMARAPASLPTPLRLAGLAVTCDHYLVVGTREPGGLLVFDLHAVGEPVILRWPVAFAPYDITPRATGGVFVLDRDNRRYWALDRRFAIVPSGPPVQLAEGKIDDFQPRDGSVRGTASRSFQQGIALDDVSPGLGDVIAIEALADDTVLLLDRGDGAFSRIAAFRDGEPLGEPVSLALVADALEEDARAGFRLVGHDMALIRDQTAKNRATLFVAAADGNQCFAFDLTAGDDGISLTVSHAFYPMRRFGGKGLAAGGGKLFYDFAATWIPLVEQRMSRYARSAQIVTTAFDGEEPDCVWHRLMLDGCLPSGTDVAIESRAANDLATLSGIPWQAEPPLYRRGDGSELAWPAPMPATDGPGTFELLFQNARGKYLQLRLTLSGNERSSPRLKRLRAWFPRFSYLSRYLPAIYRSDANSAFFLDRFLANMEGTNTTLEDRVAAAQILLDPRSTPSEFLGWLASWFGTALDPGWDERRQRLFIRCAMTFFRWRGTVHGLRMALTLALKSCVTEADLGDPVPQPATGYDIRIIERFLTRRYPPVALGDTTQAAGIQTVTPQAHWAPRDGTARLSDLYAAAIGTPGARFRPVPPADSGEAQKWTAFADRVLGFVPTAAAELATLWRNFLTARYGTVDALAAAWGQAAQAFTDIDLPADVPGTDPRASDWQDFLNRLQPRDALPLRQWQNFLSRRYHLIRALNAAYATGWTDFAQVPLPDYLPASPQALADWHAFESIVQPMNRTAHRFSVLIPTPPGPVDRAKLRRMADLARRIVELEKPAHTIFDVGLYWAMFRIGEARLGLDTVLDAGSRSPDLLPPVVLGLDYVGESHLDRSLPKGRTILECA